jgi:hypothetical protein
MMCFGTGGLDVLKYDPVDEEGDVGVIGVVGVELRDEWAWGSILGGRFSYVDR